MPNFAQQRQAAARARAKLCEDAYKAEDRYDSIDLESYKATKPDTMAGKGNVSDIPVQNTHYEMTLKQQAGSIRKSK